MLYIWLTDYQSKQSGLWFIFKLLNYPRASELCEVFVWLSRLAVSPPRDPLQGVRQRRTTNLSDILILLNSYFSNQQFPKVYIFKYVSLKDQLSDGVKVRAEQTAWINTSHIKTYSSSSLERTEQPSPLRRSLRSISIRIHPAVLHLSESDEMCGLGRKSHIWIQTQSSSRRFASRPDSRSEETPKRMWGVSCAEACKRVPAGGGTGMNRLLPLC